MNILVIQGPNLNLLGVKSASTGNRLTMDKINKALRRKVRNQTVDLKIHQSHKIEKVISILQRNRNWADGILLAPMAWARYEWSLWETLSLIRLPVVEIFFDGDFNMGTEAKDSILSDLCVDTITGEPLVAFNTALDTLCKHLNSNMS